MHTVIYTNDNCPACEQAKDTLREHGVPFEERKLEDIRTSRDDGLMAQFVLQDMAAPLIRIERFVDAEGAVLEYARGD